MIPLRTLLAPLAFLLLACSSFAKPADIYDEQLVGTEQIKAALEIAKAEDKRVLLQFGANWCVWCHRLHELYQSDSEVKTKLDSDYVLVLVDVNKGNNAEVNERYGKPTQHGLPVIVILDSDGAQLVTQETGALESGQGHDPAKVMAFLEKWSL
ncbi:hypothetical protein VDG1235_68 [Verrucomicrobiia bacterium DG1235]|nr:hypothetical protein VDG1235_68 [Verrucomicrobiae bacterium DG1235]